MITQEMQEKLDECLIQIQVKSFESVLRLRPENIKETKEYFSKCAQVQKEIEDLVEFILNNSENLPDEVKSSLEDLLKGSRNLRIELESKAAIFSFNVPVIMPQKMEIN